MSRRNAWHFCSIGICVNKKCDIIENEKRDGNHTRCEKPSLFAFKGVIKDTYFRYPNIIISAFFNFSFAT